eukprot:COSAG05_NODE_24638_length_237_cov_11215.152174_1_plen_22_part_10
MMCPCAVMLLLSSSLLSLLLSL